MEPSIDYRIVRSFHITGEPACMPALTKAHNGNLLLAFSTEWEPMPWGGILKLTVSGNEGKTWSEPRILWKDEDPRVSIQVSNGMQTLRNGDILLPVTRSIIPKRSNVPSEEKRPTMVYDVHSPDRVQEVWLFRSRDHGQTWQRKTPKLPSPWWRFGRILETRDGRLIMPGEGWYVESLDLGKTWSPKIRFDVPKELQDEINIVETADDSWLVIFRYGGGLDKPRRTFATTFSHDQGRTWDQWRWTDVIGKMPDLLVLPSGRILMAVGAEGVVTKMYVYPDRSSFSTLFISDDHGRTWKRDVSFVKVDPDTPILPADSPVMCELSRGRILVVIQGIDLAKKDDPLFTFSAGMSLMGNIIEPV